MNQWQFQIDGRPAAPIRDHWLRAARDAVGQGYAIWDENNDILIDSDQGATIARIHGKE